VFIDPLPLAPPALEELTAIARPAAIVLTSANHERAAARFRERFAVPIIAHTAAAPELGIPVDRTVADGEMIFEGLTVIFLPGAAPGEIALFDARGWMIVGDALIHLEPHGLTFLPDKYCADAGHMRESLRKLLPFPFELLTFAHGSPLVSRARQRLENLLA
ncbi:MAG: hypothetical protein M3463_22500, partial [Verrucomicrobiota bacterium]|nr:hypothetical protein [Verrucomicrobiota bacterium]